MKDKGLYSVSMRERVQIRLSLPLTMYIWYYNEVNRQVQALLKLKDVLFALKNITKF